PLAASACSSVRLSTVSLFSSSFSILGRFLPAPSSLFILLLSVMIVPPPSIGCLGRHVARSSRATRPRQPATPLLPCNSSCPLTGRGPIPAAWSACHSLLRPAGIRSPFPRGQGIWLLGG